MSRVRFHAGERRMQELTGETVMAERNGAILGTRIPSGAMDFVRAQRVAASATTDPAGKLWATLLIGAPGYLDPVDGTRVRIASPSKLLDHTDPVVGSLAVGGPVGLLIIDLTTRQRLRLNGVVSQKSVAEWGIAIEEAYPNCPKYIQRRSWVETGAVVRDHLAGPVSGTTFGARERELFARADTAFVGSRHRAAGHDVSHRGGLPGFLHVLNDCTLRIPDYIGNGMYNTLGNLLEDPDAALTIPDFAQGRLLHCTGTALIEPRSDDDPALPTGGTGRYWQFRLDAWVLTEAPGLTVLKLEENSRYCPR